MIYLILLLPALYASRLSRRWGHRLTAVLPLAGVLGFALALPSSGTMDLAPGEPVRVIAAAFFSAMFFLSGAAVWFLLRESRAGLALVGLYLLDQLRIGEGFDRVWALAALAVFAVIVLRLVQPDPATASDPAAVSDPGGASTPSGQADDVIPPG